MEAAITSVLEEHLARIQRAFQEHGFIQAGDVADRHGALQLTFTKESNGLAWLVLLSEAVGTGEDDYRGSVDVVVQADDRFVRRRVIASNSREAFESEVTGAVIDAAVALADSLNEEDLAESFALRPPDSDESMTDPIADLLIRIRNGIQSRHDRVEMPSSKLKVEVSKILKSEGFISNYRVVHEGAEPSLCVYLKYSKDGEPVIHGIERVSRPGRRVYRGKEDIPQMPRGLGLAIVSTSKGVLSADEAERSGVGGEVLCQVW